MEINLKDLELLTILQGLEALHDQAKEYREISYENQKDFLVDLNSIRNLHNKLLIEAQNKGFADKNFSLI